MEFTGIIAEWNPFHKGHEKLIKFAKERHPDRPVAAVMSSAVVERGEPAVFSAAARAKMALSAGCDAVFALPARTSLSSAGAFAEGGVLALASFSGMASVCFGAECGDAEALEKAAVLLENEEPARADKIREGLSEGLSYPAARAAAFPEAAELLEQPNNTLGIEYIRALKRHSLEMEPLVCQRDESLESSRFIRGFMALGNPKYVRAQLPEASYGAFRKAFKEEGVLLKDDFSFPLFSSLWDALYPEELAGYEGISESLANRLFALRGDCAAFTELAEGVKNKSLTMTHVNRALMAAALRLKKKKDGHVPPFLTLVGYKNGSKEAVSELMSGAKLPVIARPFSDIEKLDPKTRAAFIEDARILRLTASVRANKMKSPVKDPLLEGVVRI